MGQFLHEVQKFIIYNDCCLHSNTRSEILASLLAWRLSFGYAKPLVFRSPHQEPPAPWVAQFSQRKFND
jgi:hypothetical protein